MSDSAGDARVAAAYDARAAEYIALIGSIEQMERADIALIGRWRDETPGPLLDAGCGPGQWTAFLADSPPGCVGAPRRDVVGVDVSAEFLMAARERHPALRFERASIRALPFPDGAFGGILAWYSLIHLAPPELPAVVAELGRVLAPGGRLLIGFFDGEPRERFAHAVTPAYYWSAEALTALLDDTGLVVVHAECREREPGTAGSVRPHGAIIAERRSSVRWVSDAVRG
ncbi:class I SAM-dependent methyltransferase [Microbacterium sp. 22242]|uniref:class I SAM-dependent methyltransferase n=1 Tax=Microbacterium sp. 22242 TaxID=3453896 RepID=UPI003F871ED8